MTQHITQDQIVSIHTRYGGDMVNCANAIARQAVANYIEQQSKDLQAERIKEQEAEQSDLDVAYTDQVLRAMSAEEERDELRAELAAIAATEPVAWAISYDGITPYTLWHEGDGALLDGEVKRQGGTTVKMALFTHPMPAGVTELVDALESIVAMENTDGNEWDAVESVIPEMCDTARTALSKYKGAK